MNTQDILDAIDDAVEEVRDTLARHLADKLGVDLAELQLEYKAIDMTKLIGGIDCEFCDIDAPDQWHRIGKLKSVTDTSTPYWLAGIGNFVYCRPRMEHVHFWYGGECPLPEGLIVKVLYRRCGFKIMTVSEVSNDDWQYQGDLDTNIVGFEIMGIENGYCFPWEIEE